MPSDPLAEAHHALVQALARLQLAPENVAQLRTLGLQLSHVRSEDGVRSSDAAAGPASGDTTIQVQSRRHGQLFATCMPALRFPGLAERSADLPLAAIRLRVGNHRGEPPRTIGLRDYLGDLRTHLTRPDSWAGADTSLLATRDSHAQVRAQACLLPVPRVGLASFTPVVFDHLSRVGAPATLAILATREGTSATVLDHRRDRTRLGLAVGQRLLFNLGGQRAPFTGARTGEPLSPGTGPGAGVPAALLIQVPLRQPPPPPDRFAGWGILPMEQERGIRVAESAVIGHAELEGPYIEIDDLAIERDDRHPIHVTVQIYHPTCEAVLGEDALVELGAQIERMYVDADAVGSLVDPGDTGIVREPDDAGADTRKPPGW